MTARRLPSRFAFGPYARSALATAAGRALTYLSAFAALWVAIQLLGPAGFGAYSVAMALIWIASIPAGLGLDQLILVRVARGAGRLPDSGAAMARQAVLLVVLAGSAVAALVALAAPAIAAGTDLPGFAGWIRGLAPLIPLIAALLLMECWFVALGRLWASQLFGALGQALRFPLLLLAWWADAGMAGVLAAELMVASFPLLLYFASAGWLRGPLGPRFDRESVRPAAALMLGRLVSDGVKRGDLLLLGAIAPPGPVADYALAGRLMVAVEAGRDLLQPGFTARAGERLARGDRAALMRDFTLVQSASLLVALAVASLFMLAGPWLLALFGPFQQALAPLALLAAAALANVGSGPNNHLLKLTGHAEAILLIRLLAFGLLVALALALVPTAGAAGAAAAALMASLAANAGFFLLLWRRERLLTLAPRALLLLVFAVGLLATVGAGLLASPLAGIGLAMLALAVLVVEPLSWQPARDALQRLTRPPEKEQ
jgi:O-antigen/teichoic acid export membrane protein